jgi:hypothetical protein
MYTTKITLGNGAYGYLYLSLGVTTVAGTHLMPYAPTMVVMMVMMMMMGRYTGP